MNLPFGEPVNLYSGDAHDGSSETSAHKNMDLVRGALLGFNDGGSGFLRIYRPAPTAAFSPQDTTSQYYSAAAEAMRAMGFAPVERLAGGRLAIYDEGALVIDLVAPHAEPRDHVHERYQLFSSTIAAALSSLGIDARVGGLPAEYCPGDYSVNGGGSIKLVGVAQRIARRGYHVGAVLSASPSRRSRNAVVEAYRILGVPFDPSTYGSASELAPDARHESVRAVLLDRISRLLHIRKPQQDRLRRRDTHS